MRTLIVNKMVKQTNIVNYIKSSFPAVNIAVIHKALRQKDIKINGKRINKNEPIKNGDIIELYILDNLLYNLPDKIDTIYEDDNILVVFKPQGLLTNNPDGDEPSLESILNNKDLTLCHRLDRNTAGLVIFTKNENATCEMLEGFKQGYIIKNYMAYVSGTTFKKEHDILEQYLFHDNKKGYSKIVDKNYSGAQKIITEYTVLDKNMKKDYSILKVTIHTGKTHQIRVALSSISHPIIGDLRYGINEVNKKFNTYKQLLFAFCYSFCFPKNCNLSYLNSINIELNKDYICKSIGSDIIGK